MFLIMKYNHLKNIKILGNKSNNSSQVIIMIIYKLFIDPMKGI